MYHTDWFKSQEEAIKEIARTRAAGRHHGGYQMGVPLNKLHRHNPSFSKREKKILSKLKHKEVTSGQGNSSQQ